jgi:hypothetical protein
MENPEKATAVLRELSEAGAGLALDDFGTGYSSLSYLNQFTFDTIKIDRSFLQATSGENGSGPVILRSVVALAHELGKKVVVEGIETEDDVSLLRTIGCEYGQGFYYYEPMSEREALQLVKVARRSERRMKRRSLLRKRERALEEGPAEESQAPVQAEAPRTAAKPRLAANGAPHPEPAAASPQAPAAKTTPRPVRTGAPAAQPVAATPPSQPPATSQSAATPPQAPPPAMSEPTAQPPPAALSPPLQVQPQANGAHAVATAPAPAAAVPTHSPVLPRTGPPRTTPPPLPPRPAAPAWRTGPPPLPGTQARTDSMRPAPVNGRPPRDFSNLPPTIRDSLARLAGHPSGEPASPAPESADVDGKPPAV